MVRQDDKPVYILDSSAWIEFDRRAGDNRIPTVLQKLLNEGRLRAPKEVFRELQKPGAISDWVKENRRSITAPRGLPSDYATNLGKVQFQFPAMGKALGGKERADPYVVALSKTENEKRGNPGHGQEWIVVSGETLGNRPRRKISGACDELGLNHVTIDELLNSETEANDGETT